MPGDSSRASIVPLQQFLFVREHVLTLMTSKRYAGTLPVVPSASLAASTAAQIYLLRRPALLPLPPCRCGPETPAFPNSSGSTAPSP
jgi:hypothetical protein